MKGLGFDAPARGLAKYDPNQPRVPAGSGRNSGRWGSGGGAAQTPAPATNVPRRPSLPPSLPCAPRARRELWPKACSLRRKAARFSRASKHWRRWSAPRRRLAIFVPTRGRRVAWRDAGRAGLSYSFDEPAGLLRLYGEDESGRKPSLRSGCVPMGFSQRANRRAHRRMMNGSLVFDAVAPELTARVKAQSKRDEPKLCPDPAPTYSMARRSAPCCIKSKSAA